MAIDQQQQGTQVDMEEAHLPQTIDLMVQEDYVQMMNKQSKMHIKN